MEAKETLQYEIYLLDAICRGLQATLNVDKIVHIILTGLTAGASLGFSRAAIFFINETGILHGGRGIGPYDQNEAGQIWKDLTNSDVALTEMFDNSHRRTLESQRFPVEIKSIRYEIAKLPASSPLKKVIDANETVLLKEDERFLVPDEFHWFVRYATQVVIAPITISGKISAVVFADNAFHYKEITPATISFLSIVLNQAGLALSNAFAYEATRHNLQQVQHLNEKLRQVQEELLACERFAAAGRISTYLAHEIRNPLATIGGFARQILEISREKSSDPRIARNARIIANEVRRLELVLNNLLRFSFKQPAKKQNIHLLSFL
ncbi:MAG TPA: histidine kinase dimerization/phospho-acceptor domain-containing protein, partial [bacterium]|nr:histidine kinase dimerization/phospho-acceptor domain-containing protein [bacterium]